MHRATRCLCTPNQKIQISECRDWICGDRCWNNLSGDRSSDRWRKSGTKAIVGFGSTIPGIIGKNLNDAVKNERAGRVKQFVCLWVVIADKRIVRWDHHRQKGKEPLSGGIKINCDRGDLSWIKDRGAAKAGGIRHYFGFGGWIGEAHLIDDARNHSLFGQKLNASRCGSAFVESIECAVMKDRLKRRQIQPASPLFICDGYFQC